LLAGDGRTLLGGAHEATETLRRNVTQIFVHKPANAMDISNCNMYNPLYAFLAGSGQRSIFSEHRSVTDPLRKELGN
jgi:hypothetical protein